MGDLLGIAREWRQVLREIDADSRLSHEGKREKVNAAGRHYAADLRAQAAHERSMVRTRVERRRADLAKARTDAAGDWDFARLAIEYQDAAGWAQTTDFDAARERVKLAAAGGDRYELRALMNAAYPVLVNRSRTEQSLEDRSATVVELRDVLQEAMEALRPATLAQAEAAYNEALQDAQAVEREIFLADGETAVAIGRGPAAPGVLRDETPMFASL